MSWDIFVQDFPLTSALIVAEILDRLNLRALDSMTGEFFQLAQTEESLTRYREYKMQISPSDSF